MHKSIFPLLFLSILLSVACWLPELLPDFCKKSTDKSLGGAKWQDYLYWQSQDQISRCSFAARVKTLYPICTNALLASSLGE